MKSELLQFAYSELDYLEKQPPSMKVIDQINALHGAIKYIESKIEISSNEVSKIIDDLVYYYGEMNVIEKLKQLLTDIKNDIDMISPNVGAIMIKKLKEIKENG